MRLAASLRTTAAALLDSTDEGVVLAQHMFRRLYRRLVWTFRAEVTSFERKRYVSLSHEANKAMNLNSYMGLMGGSYREVRTVTGTALVRSGPDRHALNIPDPDYIVTLDADSVLLPEYCLRLVHLLEQNEYRDMAIAQTPYSAFPGSSTRLERIAGATTDLQHIVHQGLTYYDATFWVGANAVIRKRALDDIVETSYIGDWEIRHYIRDRTVIEDTESTIDMGVHGWRLYNCPERMSYSATPPDFGSLAIQRRRWANGGLLILPKLRRQSRARRRQGKRTRFGELFLRWNYMASISWSSISLLILLAFPFSATFPRYGVRLRSQQIWQRLGATVMIGQNNITGENFTVSDAQGLARFASATHLGRISMWSLNRDSQCGTSFPESGLLSNTCSGTAQSSLQFSQIFGQLQGVTSVSSAAGNVQPAVANTNPADAPYPQWSATGDYPLGYKVAENGEIYQAKWFNTGDDPQAQVQYSWQTPWELLGPVLPGYHAPVILRPAAGTYPSWSISISYKAGDKVLYQGLPYESKWNNQGVSPQGALTDPADSPWKTLYAIPGEPAGAPVIMSSAVTQPGS